MSSHSLHADNRTEALRRHAEKQGEETVKLKLEYCTKGEKSGDRLGFQYGTSSVFKQSDIPLRLFGYDPQLHYVTS